MPNRIIKDSIRTSKSINAMSDFQFRLWAYLITYVDDYGRGSADPELLKGFVFPRRKGVTEGTISKTLAELATIGSVILYEVDGEPYLCFPNWSEHQTVRNKVSKFPAPADGLITSEINCNQLQACESKCAHKPQLFISGQPQRYTQFGISTSLSSGSVSRRAALKSSAYARVSADAWWQRRFRMVSMAAWAFISPVKFTGTSCGSLSRGVPVRSER